MIINHNLNAMGAHRNMSFNTANTGKAMEKLSSGLRINRAGDDAAGLAISEKMRGQIRGLDQATRNAQDGISMIQTAEGALNETHSILQRMRELSVQASNDTNNTDDREAIGDELLQLKGEVDRIANTTSFNGKKLLSGDLSTKVDAASTTKVGTAVGATVISNIDLSGAKGSGATYTFDGSVAGKITLTRNDGVSQTIDSAAITAAEGSKTFDFAELGVKIELSGADTATNIEGGLDAKVITTKAAEGGANFLIGSNGTSADETLTVAFAQTDSTTLGSGFGNMISDKVTGAANTIVDSASKANDLIQVLDDSIKGVSKQRSALGAAQNRLEHTINNLNVGSENLQAAESRIRDVDMAKEMMNFTKNNILNQAAQAMLSQANQQPQAVLQLLR